MPSPAPVPFGGRQPLPIESIETLCRRAFGSDAVLLAAREFGPGSINTAYRIELRGHDPVVLRVGPSSEATERAPSQVPPFLLRREQQVQPFLAPVAHLLPKTVAADFTRQLIPRDYVFQTLVAGEPWEEIYDDLSADDTASLWRELGGIARSIHGVTGDAFGPPFPSPSFASLGDAVVDDLETVLQDLNRHGLPSGTTTNVLALVERHRDRFDEVATPRLLHGDLELRHVLVDHGQGGARIVGLIDHEFARWGEPTGESLLIRFALAPPPGSEPFWETYGHLPEGTNAEFRRITYQCLAMSQALLETRFSGDEEGRGWVGATLQDRVAALRRLGA